MDFFLKLVNFGCIEIIGCVGMKMLTRCAKENL
jgi:hypothetical protein